MQLPSNGHNKPLGREDLARDWAEHRFNAGKTYEKSSRMRWSAETGQTEDVGALISPTRRSRPCQRPRPRMASGLRRRRMLPTRRPFPRHYGSWCRRTRRRGTATTTFRRAQKRRVEMVVVHFIRLPVVDRARARRRRYQCGRDHPAPEVQSLPSQSEPPQEASPGRVDGRAARVLCIITRATSVAMPAALTGQPPRMAQSLHLQARNGHVVLARC